MSSTILNRNDPCACGSGKKYKKCCLVTARPDISPIAPNGRQAEQMLDAAIAHQKAGRLTQAEELYRQLQQIRPDLPDPPHLLGVIAHLKGEHRQAVELIEKAIALRPTASMYGNLAAVNIALGNLEAAADLLRQGLQLDAKHADCLNNLGYVLKSQGKLAEAMECFLEAIAHKPGHAGAYSNLGNAAFDMGHFDEAIRCYRVALSINPEDFATRNSLGVALKETGDMQSAIQEFEQVLVSNPQFGLAYNNLGNVARDLGQPELAIEFFRRTLELDPSQNKLHSNLLFAMLVVPSYSQDEIFSEHLRFAEQFETPLKPFWQAHDNLRDKHKRLKVGYVSGDFRSHAVAYFIEPVLATHDKSQVEIFCYYNNHQNDDVTRRFAAFSDHWISCGGWSDDTLAARIREDGIDILIDLSGHTRHNRLLTFARKPAPIQITWIGYPATTGLSAMDYRITDRHYDPEGMTERYHSEALLRLPMAGLFKPEAIRPPINALPALTKGVFTFACLNNLAKIREENIALWAQILFALPHARLMLGNVDDLAKPRLVDIFAKYGIGEERLDMHQKMPLGDFLALHHQIDLALDPFPYTGGTTTLHALSMGVPVITLAGNSPVSRCGAGIMGNVGLPEFIAASPEEYVKLAIAFASNLSKLDQVRQSLRAGNAIQSESEKSSFTHHLEQVLRQVWGKWCDTKPEAL